MAENGKTISELTELTTLNGSEDFAFQDGALNGKVKASTIKGFVQQDLTPYQEKQSDALETEDKTVVGAINELSDKWNNGGVLKLLSYGIEFDTAVSSPACKRIGSLSLHVELPIHNRMRGCLLDDDGNVVKYLDPEDWTGEVRDGSQGQVMVELPEYWRKFETEGTKRRVWLSEIQLPGFHLVPKRYVSAYQATVQRNTLKLASVANTDTDYRGGNNTAAYDGTGRSLLGTSASYISRADFRTYARNRKEGSTEWNCMVYGIQKDLYWLFCVEYATLNTQAAYNPQLTAEGFAQGGLGAGVTTLNYAKWTQFNGSNPFIPCGYTDALGNGTGQVGYTMPEEYTGATNVVQVPRYRGIENPFGHCSQWTDGINIRTSPPVSSGGDGTSKVFVCDDPAKFNDTNYDGYRYVGNEVRRNNIYIKEVIFGEEGDIIPIAGDGGSTTYHCDMHLLGRYGLDEYLSAVYFCGAASDNAWAGLLYSCSAVKPSAKEYTVTTRLCFIPS